MTATGKTAAALCLMLAVSACSSGPAKVLVQDSATPQLSASPSQTPAPTATATPSAAGPAHRRSATATAAPVAARTTSSPAGTRTTAASKAPTTTTTSRPATPPATTACTSTGKTVTMQVTAPDRFSPASLDINRCDAVRAVYSDSTGAPHTWQGKGWNSGDLTTAGQSYTYRFSNSGTYNFYCAYHQSIGMTGTVTVH